MTYEYMRGNGTGGATTEVFYTYDELHQVVTAKENYGNKTRTYQYDSLGNLTYETNSNNVQYDYKSTISTNWWKRPTAKGKEHTVYTYDGRGNLVEEEYGKNKRPPRSAHTPSMRRTGWCWASRRQREQRLYLQRPGGAGGADLDHQKEQLRLSRRF